jgi:iron complex transport system substrate-binding protein
MGRLAKKMNKWWFLVLVMVCWMGVGFALFGQQQGEKSTALSGGPGRIVSMAPNLTEILFALGLEDEIAGVASDSDYPPSALSKSKVGTFWQPNTEAVIALNPDLIIMLDNERHRPFASSLNRAGYRVLTLELRKMEHLQTAIELIGRSTDRQLQGEELTDKITQKLDGLSSLVSAEPKVKVLWAVQSEPLRVAGRDTFVNGIIELAGGQNAIGPTVQEYPRIGTEELLACGAEVIIEAAMGADLQKQQHAAGVFWSKYPNLPAVKNERIYVVKPDTVLRLGPRLPEGLEMIAHCLHPNSFVE